MLAADFIAEFRRVMDDTARGYLWEDEEIVTYLNSAVDEACERALLLEDRSTECCCRIDIEPGEVVYQLHPAVLKVKRVALDGRPLAVTSEEELDCQSPGWEGRTGAPRAYFLTGQRHVQMHLAPRPTVAATLALTVYRTPLRPVPLTGYDKAAIELPELYHLRLMPWLYRCALLKVDTEVHNPIKAAEHEAIFERSFGARPDANVQRKRRDRKPPVVRSAW
jgi:hypothetical protein